MRFAFHGIETSDAASIRMWRTNRMLARTVRDIRPYMQTYIDWMLPDDLGSDHPCMVPKDTHLFDWLEREHQIETCFVCADGKPLALLDRIAEDGHVLAPWSSALLTLHAGSVPALFFSAPLDAVLFRFQQTVP